MRKNKPRIGANPPFGRGESDLLFLTLATLVPRLARPSSGTFGQILSAPQRLPTGLCLPHFETTTRKSYSKNLLMMGDWAREIPLTGAAGAATGFARTFPMRDEQDSEAGLRK
ncbi:hypothetical protein ASJ83_04465 [Methanocorpusculum parvum]|uniref:Uncharacterized protein n=1 Tax=Methanocorpusculum parvum TaxID=2193 RepID=A0AAX0QA32_9EURY|nr:hypothetical protein ASJ83_04465 [Methanocorpusculum parvum]